MATERSFTTALAIMAIGGILSAMTTIPSAYTYIFNMAGEVPWDLTRVLPSLS